MILYFSPMLSIDKYWNIIDRIDNFAAGWSTSPPFSLKCHPGCEECCHARISLFAVEVAAINQALKDRGMTVKPVRKGKGKLTCPFLLRGRCAIYQVRPVICRTQGYPFTYRDESGETAGDICIQNKSRREVRIPAKYVLNLETLNKCFASVNFLYLAEMEEEGTVVPARMDILNILDYPADSRGV